jgi:hypothetical protein
MLWMRWATRLGYGRITLLRRVYCDRLC